MTRKSLFLLIWLCSSLAWAEKINQLTVGYKDSDHVTIRVITEEKKCPTVQVDDKFVSTTIINKDAKELLACVAEASSKSKKIQYEKQIIHLPQAGIKKIAIIGDTGCRLKLSAMGFDFQDCKNENKWPFQKIVHSIATEKPDLVIHVGDYHYRESCSDKKLCGPYMDTIGYTWKAWNADFITPGSELLSQVPWIFVRGNHEDCQRAHAGYFEFVSAGGKIFDSCPKEEADQWIQIGDLLFVNIDVSAVEDLPTMDPSRLTELIEKFKKIKEKIESSHAKEAWLLLHKPIWGIAPKMKNVFEVNMNLAKVLEAAGTSKKMKFVIAGHVHNFQVSAKKDSPTQIIVGESGTSLDAAVLKDNQYIRHDDYKVFMPTQQKDQFGYFLLVRESENKTWLGQIKNIDGDTQYRCQFPQAHCEK